MTYCSSYKKGVTGYFIAVILLPVIVLGVIATGCRSDQRVILDRLPDVLDFKEEQLLAGQSMIEKLSYVSQLDQLDSTGWDEYRCSSSAALNCYLYMGGSWPNLVSLLGLSDSGLTYSNIHQSQERLFALAGGDSTGILGMYYPKWSNRGDLTGYQVKKKDRKSTRLNSSH